MSIRKVLIAGGGIGGMTAALCLLRAGFQVRVFEQAAELGEIGAGIQISANAGRVLAHLGLMDRLEAVASRPERYRFALYDSGEVLQEIPLGDSYAARHGVPYLTVHRADYHALLAEAVAALDPEAVRLNAAVAGYEEDSRGVSLRLADGSSHRGDVLIGADGIKSAVRGQMLGVAPPHYTGDAAWRVLVARDDLPAGHPTDRVTVWVGPHRHAVTYPVRGGALMNFVGCVEDENWREDSWTAKRPWEDMKRDFEGWHDEIQAILDAADRDACFRWAMNNRPPVDNWSTARVTLLGDSAHPTLPYMAQGAAMAVEDAAVIARALKSEAEPGAALDLYQRNRLDRTARIVTESSANRKLFHLPTLDDLRQAFAKRDLSAERGAWLFSYDPTRVELL